MITQSVADIVRHMLLETQENHHAYEPEAVIAMVRDLENRLRQSEIRLSGVLTALDVQTARLAEQIQRSEDMNQSK